MITISGTKPIDDNKQWVFLTITVDGDGCKFTHIASAELTVQALQDCVDAREDEYKRDILKDMYPGAKPIQAPELTELENFEMWISTGQINVDENDDKVFIPKIPWVGTHPSDMILFGEAGILVTIKKEVREYIHSRFDAEVQCSMSAINQSVDATEDQRAVIKTVFDWVLSVMVYYYARKAAIMVNWESQWDFSTFDATAPAVSLGDVIALGIAQ